MKKKKFTALFLAAVMTCSSLPFATTATAADFPNTPVITNGSDALEDLRVDYMVNPFGIDSKTPVFSWKLASSARGQKQTAYHVFVAKDAEFTDVVWDSGLVETDKSTGVSYGSTGDADAIKSKTDYFWRVTIKDANGKEIISDTATFTTAFLTTDQSEWPEGIQWIGNPHSAANNSGTWNPQAVSAYSIQFNFSIPEGGSDKFTVVYAARNKLTYAFAEVNFSKFPATITIRENYENTTTTKTTYNIPETVVANTEIAKRDTYTLKITQTSTTANTVGIAKLGGAFSTASATLSSTPSNAPRRWYMNQYGFKVDKDASVLIDSFVVNNNGTTVYTSDDFSNPDSKMASFGTIVPGTPNKLLISGQYKLTQSVAATMLRKEFSLPTDKTIKKARMYATARGVYEAYINGEKVSDSYFNPNFTEFTMRIMYQTFDVTNMLRPGANAIGAYIGKGWYASYNGYSGAQNSGALGDMLAFIEVEYTDGSTEVVVKTDNTWSFTDKSPIINADFMDGEIYDATMEMPGWDMPGFAAAGWVNAGVKNPPSYTTAVALKNNNNANGYFYNLQTKFKLSAQKGPLAVVERIIPALNLDNPKVCTKVQNGVNLVDSNVIDYVYDLGQNMVGVPQITVKGARGVEINIRGAEIADWDGYPYNANYRTAYNTTSYTLKGDPNGETYTPRFTFNGFRYVIITIPKENVDTLPEILAVNGLVLTNTPAITGDFDSSNELVNKLQENIQWGQRGNYLFVPTDCPQRNERMGWTGDAQVFSGTAAYNMDVAAFLMKWMQDMRDSQIYYNQGGAVPDTVPLGGDNRGSQYGCSGWADAGVMVPWSLYESFGDEQILIDSYDVMRDMTIYRGSTGARDTVKGDPNSWVVKQQRRGDHLTYDSSTPFILSGTAYAAHICNLMAKTATILGKTADAELFTTYYNNFKKGFNDMYVLEDGSIAYMGESQPPTNNILYGYVGSATQANIADYYGNKITTTYYSEEYADPAKSPTGNPAPPSQTAYALAIDFGLLPEDKMEAAGEFLVKSVERRDTTITVGFLGISHICPALSKVGRDDIAYTLLENEGLPSWLYSVKQGATTIWERWNSYDNENKKFGDVSMNSFNHYSYGAIGEWMYNTVLGIGIDQNNPGYKHLVLRPTVGGTFTYADGYHISPFGRIESGWKTEDGVFKYDTIVPANSTATVYLPVDNKYAFIFEGGNRINVGETVNGVTFVGFEGNRARLEIGSGAYSFAVEPDPSAPVVTNFTIAPAAITSGYAANIAVSVSGNNLNGAVVYLNNGTTSVGSKALVDGKAVINLAAHEVPTAGKYNVCVAVGEDIISAKQIEVIAANENTWNVVTSIDDNGYFVISFATDIELKATSVVKINGESVVFEKSGNNIITEAKNVPIGASVSISGIKLPKLFPSFSFSMKFDISAIEETPNPITAITVGSSSIFGFDANKREYYLDWLRGNPLPEISATVKDGFDVTITQATVDNTTATIAVKSFYGTEQTYTINFVLVDTLYDSIRPSAWGKMIDIQSLPLGTVKSLEYNARDAYFFVDTQPTNNYATNRGDLPFVGLYPHRRMAPLSNAAVQTLADTIVKDASTGKTVYRHKNTLGSGGDAVGDTFVGIEPQNTENLAGKSIVMYTKFKPVAGSFGLFFRDGHGDCRYSAEIFKVGFTNGGIRYSTTTTPVSTASVGTVADGSMTVLGPASLLRDTYYEVWMVDSPSSANGHTCSLYIKYTDGNGDVQTLKVENLLKSSYKSNSVNWPVFGLYEGNTTAQVDIEAFNCYVVNNFSAPF